ncbi:hypothetical protein J3R30DRAFT_3286934 [Lentinula aciculospora]|uniref:UBA domain-containing protein n=1 Tax=Lentinula aciculospora TaxID=153920 RepID=A0A9W9AI53_9AGAR|nr:hypothetical protein J3R30DRAFT_3286934 [Lentinula aciculospora]
MSDSFADLWNSAAPSKPTQQPQKLGSISAQSTSSHPLRHQNDLFTQLASRSTSAANSRSITPSSAPSASFQRTSTASPSQINNNGDPFSGLFGTSSSLGNRSTANMTMAERAALVEKERMAQLLQQRQPPSSTLSAWDGLDSLASKTLATSSTLPSFAPEHDWGLGASPLNTKPEDDWDIASFANISASTADSKPSSSGAFWGIDDFSALGSQNRGLESETRDAVTDGPDDILGDLSRPVEAIQREVNERNTQSPPLHSPASRFSRNSPPPHILGQLIEMGFSIPQARTALASTDSGQDVQAALEILITNGAAGEDEGPSLNAGMSPSQRTPPQEESKPHIRRIQQIDIPRERERASSPSGSGGLQTDKILAQASEIGFNLFNRANAAWKEGKERVQKVYEEKVAATAEGSINRRGSGRSTPITTKPKWMLDGERVTDPVIDSTKQKVRCAEESAVSIVRTDDVDLFSNIPESASSHSMSRFATDSTGSSNGVYVSKFRHAKPKLSNPTSVSASPPQLPHPITAISASESTIAQSQQSKASGAHFFNLGDFPAADTAYTRAIEVLPAGHGLLIPLYNNRALVRLKVGDVQGVVSDTRQVEELIGGVSSVREELKKGNRGKIPVKGTNGDDEVVNIADALVKTWKRRAEAMEGREKWEEAGKDWERVACAEWVGQAVRAEGARAAGRCRKMQQQGPMQSKPTPAVRPPVRSPRRGPTPPSQALRSLRAANEVAESEELQRYTLKDSVEARLQTWKGGKENNIRALLASLDTVLWPEIGVQKLSMAELINEGQVKMKYMKSIAKVHPDKLNGSNSSLEQRMIAAGVFGALNEAWNTFKQ